VNQEEVQKWAKETCHVVCTASDLRCICRARGFAPLKNAKKGALAEHVEMRLLGEQGVSEALAALDEKPLWALHAMVAASEPVEIRDLYTFFGFGKGYWIEASECKRRFERIRDDLVNKGLALMRMLNSWEKRGSRYAELEVCVPEVVARQLPPLPLKTEMLPEAPVFADWMAPALEGIRNSLQLARKPAERMEDAFPKGALERGVLSVEGVRRPSIQTVHGLILRQWLGFGGKKVVKQRRHLLGALSANQAIQPKRLLLAFDRFNCALSDAKLEGFVDFGLRFGFLAELKIEGERFLVPNIGQPQSSPGLLPDFSALTDADDYVEVSLDELGPAELFLLASISTFEISDSTLRATPSLVPIGQELETLRESPWLSALLKKSRAYRKAFKTVEKRAGKVLVHSGVTVLKLGGPDINAQMAHEFGNKMAPLGNDYYAISRNDLAEMVRFAKQKGFSPKTLTGKESHES